MRVSQDPVAFAQFRRLLVGIVVELLQSQHIHADISGLQATFAPESGLRFLWFDNWMRFRGQIDIPLHPSATPPDQADLSRAFHAVWPEIIAALTSLPLADRLEIARNEVLVQISAETITIQFDLEAD